MSNNHLHNQLIKLGDMMGDGLHYEPDGKWIEGKEVLLRTAMYAMQDIKQQLRKNSMRKEFTMRCNEEQFQSVLPILNQYRIDYSKVKLDNDRRFIYHDPIGNLVRTLQPSEVYDSMCGNDFFNNFDYSVFIGRISGLDWLGSAKLKGSNQIDVIVTDEVHDKDASKKFHISFFPKKESPISSGINISAGNASLAYMEFKKTHPDIEPFCIHDKSQL